MMSDCNQYTPKLLADCLEQPLSRRRLLQAAAASATWLFVPWLGGAHPAAADQALRDPLADGSLGPELKVIPAGAFVMGSPLAEPERRDDEHPHDITIADAFAIGRYAVTFDEYDRFCAATRREKPADQGWGRGRRPVIQVNWSEALEYCAWLSQQSGQTYRLPSEAEWEYACRAGTTTPFACGVTIGTELANFDGHYTYADGKVGAYLEKTAEVGQFPPNAWGLYDMHGNIWEWTGSGYDDSYSGAERERLSASAGGAARCVVRGGSWYYGPMWLRSACRVSYPAGARAAVIGLRVVREL